MSFDRALYCVLHPVAFSLVLAAVPSAGVNAQTDDARSLTGRITDAQGYPVAGARTALLLQDGDSLITLSASDGRYSINYTGAPAALRVTLDGFRSVLLDMALHTATLDVVLDPMPYPLAAVSVTGRSRTELSAIPGAVSIVGQAVLQERAPISVGDALRTVPGLHTADEDPYGLNLNVGFRGLPPRRSSRTLLLEDGVPVLLGPYSDPSMHYAPPVEAIERMEIVRGSSQITNGPQTVGGVINFVTRRPPTEGPAARITLGGGEHGYRNAHVWAGTVLHGAGVAIDYSFREGGGVRREQGHRFHNVYLTSVLPLGSDHSLLAKASVWDEASRISETGLTQAEFDIDPHSLPFSAAGRFHVRRYGAQLLHELARGRFRIRTNTYASSVDRASWRQSGESEERLGTDGYADDFNCAPGATSYDDCGNQGRPRAYSTAGIESRSSLELARPGAGSVGATLEFGARVHTERARRRQLTGTSPHAREADAILTHDNRIDTEAVAGFLLARLRAGRASVAPALRVERVAQQVRNRFPGREASVDAQYTQLLPGIGFTLDAGKAAALFAGVHRGFAPPRPADVYRPEPGQPVVLVDPETSWNWEAGARLAPRVGISAEATLFRMDFGNQIIEAPAAAGQRFTNGGRTIHQGVEAAAHVSLGTLTGSRDDLSVSGTFTYLPVARFAGGDARQAGVAGNRLPYAPRTLLSGSASYSHRSGLTAGASIEHTGRQFADDSNTIEPDDDGQSGVLPAYRVVHAFASYAVPGTRLQLRASVRNVFDSVYITQRNEGIYTGMRRLARAEVQWRMGS